MKRIASLLLAGVFAFSGMGPALAMDIKIKGQWDFNFGWTENSAFSSSSGESKNSRNVRSNDPFNAVQQIRTQINFIASENLQGLLHFEIGKNFWGRPGTVGRGSGSALDADGVNVETKRAYLDWMVPGTDLTIRMGLQGLSLPMATGYCNPVFSADVAAVVANYKFNNMVSLTTFWARPFDAYANDSTANGGRNRHNLDDEMDMLGFVLPITGEGWSLMPWGIISNVGASAGYYSYMAGYWDRNPANQYFNGASILNDSKAIAWWTGLGFSLTMFDPLTFGIDVVYGDMHKNDLSGSDLVSQGDGSRLGTRGWFVVSNLDYKLDWATPGIFGWWSSGDSRSAVKNGQYGRMPVVGVDDGFSVTSFGSTGNVGLISDTSISETMMGTWGVGVQLAQMSFIEKLQHTLRVAYYQGTNDHRLIKDGYNPAPVSFEQVYLTDKDNAIEVNFDHKYQIYENLTVFLELGYIHLDMDKSTWGSHYLADDAWKAQVQFRYKF